MASINTRSDSVAIESFSHNGVISWGDSYTAGTYSVEWNADITQTNWSTSWKDQTEIGATGGVLSCRVPMNYRIIYHPSPTATLFSEQFENTNGWTDHSYAISWSQSANNGVWTGAFCYATTSVIRAHSGERYIGMDINIAYLYLPPINNPTQLSVWVKGTVIGQSSWLILSHYDGNAWINFSPTYAVTGTVYRNYIWPIDLGTPNPQQQLRIHCGDFSPCYIDDIEVRSFP